ncbi:MAG: hypothetical protein KY476_26255, partial [Planctomycetes bacterium]|nr:hypothetical protein [Planctomycetota bacterium]
MTLAITPELIVRDHPDQDLASFPPISMLEFLKQLNAMTCCPAIAYFCLTWGGDVEFEYAWCFPERLLLRIPVGDSRG